LAGILVDLPPWKRSIDSPEAPVTLTDLLWLATGCYGIHILEEYQLDWRNWARTALGLPVEWSDFYAVNSLVVVLGIVAATSRPTGRGLRLGFRP
jgi:hypothetical protein